MMTPDENAKWVASLKPGDEVELDGVVRQVTRITATQVLVGSRRFRRKGKWNGTVGHEMGLSTYDRGRSLGPVTDEARALTAQRDVVRVLERQIGRVNELCQFWRSADKLSVESMREAVDALDRLIKEADG